jgi:hypothetical protein
MDDMSPTVPDRADDHPRHADENHAAEPGGAAQRQAAIRGAAIPVVVGLLIGGLFVAVFLAAFHAPTPHDLPVGVVGPASTVSSVRSQAESSGALEVHSYPDREAARSAVLQRDILGAYVVGSKGPELLVAGANGPSVTQTLQGAFGAAAKASGQQLTTTDVRPISSGDTRALSVFYGAFGVVLAGFLFGLTSMQMGPKLPASWRAVSAAAFSVGAGLVVAWLIQPVFGALPAPFWVTTAIVTMLALAISVTTAMLLKVFGSSGTFVASVVLLVFGNATSTGILPAQYLPGWLEPWASILPVGVAVRALRGAAYFDDDGLASGLLILGAWIVGAALIFVLSDRLKERGRRSHLAA